MTFNETNVRSGRPDHKGKFRDNGHSAPERV